MSWKRRHQSWTREMCTCLLRSLLIWSGEVHLHIYKERTMNQSAVDTSSTSKPMSFSGLPEKSDACVGQKIIQFSINKTYINQHVHLTWDKGLLLYDNKALERPPEHPGNLRACGLSFCPWLLSWPPLPVGLSPASFCGCPQLTCPVWL